jgi:hypothetical protein
MFSFKIGILCAAVICVAAAQISNQDVINAVIDEHAQTRSLISATTDTTGLLNELFEIKDIQNQTQTQLNSVLALLGQDQIKPQPFTMEIPCLCVDANGYCWQYIAANASNVVASPAAPHGLNLREFAKRIDYLINGFAGNLGITLQAPFKIQTRIRYVAVVHDTELVRFFDGYGRNIADPLFGVGTKYLSEVDVTYFATTSGDVGTPVEVTGKASIATMLHGVLASIQLGLDATPYQTYSVGATPHDHEVVGGTILGATFQVGGAVFQNPAASMTPFFTGAYHPGMIYSPTGTLYFTRHQGAINPSIGSTEALYRYLFHLEIRTCSISADFTSTVSYAGPLFLGQGQRHGYGAFVAV